MPTGLKEKALFEQAASVELSHFDAYASKVAFEKIWKPYVPSKSGRPRDPSHLFTLNTSRLRGLTPDIAVFDNLISELGTKLDVYEVILSKQKYIAGDVSSSPVDNDQW